MTEQEPTRSELDLVDLIDMIWDGRLLVIVVTLLSLAAGALVYFLTPERFRSELEITPLTAAKFAQYADLQEAGSFHYTRSGLALEFARYLTDRDRLARAEEESQAPAVKVVFTIEDEPAGQAEASARELVRVRMMATHGNEDQLDTFVAVAIRQASRDLAMGIHEEINTRLAAAENGRIWAIKRTELMIAAEREKLAAERMDSIQKLKSEALVARSFGLERPIELQAQTLAIDRFASNSGSQQPPSEEQTRPPSPRYLDGYLALEEQVSLLEKRENDDAFIPRLREMQKEIYLLKNSTQREQLTAVLARSILNKPEEAQFVTYSLTEAKAYKDFPKPHVFAIAALAFGLLAGLACAIIRGLRVAKRRQVSALTG